MAKKTVASLQKKGVQKMTKAIRFVRSAKGSYIPQKAIVSSDKVDEFFSQKEKN